jgi:hypothetical protein
MKVGQYESQARFPFELIRGRPEFVGHLAKRLRLRIQDDHELARIHLTDSLRLGNIEVSKSATTG